MNTLYAMNLSAPGRFPIDFEIFPMCQNKSVKQINDLTCFSTQTLLLTGWSDLLVHQADVIFTVVPVKVNILHGPAHATSFSVCLPY